MCEKRRACLRGASPWSGEKANRGTRERGKRGPAGRRSRFPFCPVPLFPCSPFPSAGTGRPKECVLLLAACALVLILVACSPSPTSRQEIVIFAAASLTEPFDQLVVEFARELPGSHVLLNYGGSNQLRSQLEQGARADVFASANQVEMEKAGQAGLLAGSPQVFARNRLALIVPKDNPARIERLQDLARQGVKLVVAHPSVPVGGYTIQMLDRMSADPAFGTDFKERVLAKRISEEVDVKHVVAKVQLGEADAGVVYSSDVSAKVAPRVRMLGIPDQFNVAAEYPLALLQGAREPELARRFVELVLSERGQAVLARHHFQPVR